MRTSRWQAILSSMRSDGVASSFVGAVVMSIAAVFLLAATAPAVDYTWSGGTGGTWDSSATNWTGASGTPWDITNGPSNKAIFGTAGDSSILSGAVYPGYIQGTTTTTISNNGTAGNAIGYATDGAAMTIEAASGTTTTVSANINYGGTGSSGNILNVRGGGTVTIAGAANLVNNDGGAKSGYFSIEGGSTLQVSTGGYLASMILNSSNRNSAGNTFMGASSGSNTMRVNGTNGKLVTGNFNIGSAGNNGNSVYISAPGTNNTSTSTSTASWVLYGNSAQLNMSSSNNYVEVSNGAFMQQISGGGSSGWTIGNGAGQDGNQLKVTGLGSTISRGTNGYVGLGGAGANGGSGNSLVVAAGGLFVGARVGVGYGGTGVTSANNYQLITGTSDGTTSGTPSYFRENGGTNTHFLVGNGNLSTGNSFRVEAGARADLFGTGTGKNLGIGMVAGADNNYVRVTGAGSTMNFITGQELTVGGNASAAGGANCYIDISNGGSLVMSNTDNTIPLPASVSWTTWAAIPTTGTALVLAGSNAAVNLGDGQAVSLLKIGTVNTHSGVELAAASSRLNFNNGRLVADTGGNLVSGSGQVVLNGPAFVSTAKADSLISSLISGTGSFTKEGTGLLTLSNVSNAYLGDTTVNGGTLSLAAAYLADAASVTLAAGSVLNLNYLATDTIGNLVLGGVTQAAGTYGAIGSGAGVETSYLTGTGILNVAAVVPEPETMVLLGAGLAAAGFLRRRRRV